MQKLTMTDFNKGELTGLLGYPVEHSLSPIMHNAAFEKLELNYYYHSFAVKPEFLREAIFGIKGLNLKGVNVTIPYKEKVISYLDQISSEAELIGAVNTIKHQKGKLIGYNTDGKGFIKSLKGKLKSDLDEKVVLIIGAGGAARAVAFQLGLEGVASLYITNRTISKAKSLVQDIKNKLKLINIESIFFTNKHLKEVMGEVDILINATSVGMYPNHNVEPVIKPELLHSDLIVVDLVYNPIETTLLKAAKQMGAKTISGLGMLAFQGAIAFEIWTGYKAPIKLMKNILKKELIIK